MNFRLIFNLTGRILVILSLFILTSVFWAFYYNENTTIPIILSSVVAFIVGIILYLLTNNNLIKELGLKDGYFIVNLQLAGCFIIWDHSLYSKWINSEFHRCFFWINFRFYNYRFFDINWYWISSKKYIVLA